MEGGVKEFAFCHERLEVKCRMYIMKRVSNELRVSVTTASVPSHLPRFG